jgi:hypothetical protein
MNALVGEFGTQNTLCMVKSCDGTGVSTPLLLYLVGSIPINPALPTPVFIIGVEPET